MGEGGQPRRSSDDRLHRGRVSQGAGGGHQGARRPGHQDEEGRRRLRTLPARQGHGRVKNWIVVDTEPSLSYNINEIYLGTTKKKNFWGKKKKKKKKKKK